MHAGRYFIASSVDDWSPFASATHHWRVTNHPQSPSHHRHIFERHEARRIFDTTSTDLQLPAHLLLDFVFAFEPLTHGSTTPWGSGYGLSQPLQHTFHCSLRQQLRRQYIIFNKPVFLFVLVASSPFAQIATKPHARALHAAYNAHLVAIKTLTRDLLFTST